MAKNYTHYLLPFIGILSLLLSVNAFSKSEKESTPHHFSLVETIQLYKSGKVNQAKQQLVSFINTADYNDPKQRSKIYRSHLSLADIYAQQSLYHKRVKLYQKLFTHLLDWKLGNSIDGITIRQKWGQALIQIGEENKGLKTLNHALQLAERLLVNNDLRLANLRLIIAKIHVNRLEVEQATTLLNQALQQTQKNPKKESQIIVGRIKQAQGELMFRQARTQKAAKIYQEALLHRQNLLGINHLETAQSLVSYASALKGLHRFSEAEELYRQGFAIYDHQLGAEHSYIATILNNMGQLYYLQGRYELAEKVLLRALAIKRKYFSEKHISLAETYNHLGYLYFNLANYEQAEQYLDKAIQIWSLPDSLRPRYRANAETTKAIIWLKSGKGLLKTITKFQQQIEILQSIFGQYTIATADAFYYLGQAFQHQGEHKKAEQAYLQGIMSASQFSQGDWLAEILIHSKLARLYVQDGQLKKAVQETDKSLQGLELRIKRFSGLRAHSLTTELHSLRDSVIDNISVLYAILQADPQQTIGMNKNQLLEKTFKAAQTSRSSSVARALSQVEQRFSSANDRLAEIVRERQNLIEEWQEIDAILSAAMSKNEQQRERSKEQDLILLAQQIKQKIETIDQELQIKHPSYSHLTQPSPLTIKQVQNVLKADESLLVFLFGKEKSYLWAITPTQAEIFQLDMFEKKLERMVRRLRTRLEPRPNQSATHIPPFPVKQAHLLYRKILQPAMPILESSQKLYIVADQSLQSLPLSVLVTQLPRQRIRKAIEHKQAAWLIAQKSLVTLPAVSALSYTTPANTLPSAPYKFLGIGDPALKEASEKQQLRTRQIQQISAEKPSNSSPYQQLFIRSSTLNQRTYRGTNIALRSILGNRSAGVDIEKISSMTELPDTADELKQVSEILDDNKNQIYLRQQATKNQLQNTNTEHYQIIQFATHGLMAGEFQGLFEPALVLTPDIDNDINDNGLLTASDISQLNLNADFVVLSACNTAAPDGTPGAEGLSGLGQAFFYAGSKALLVTHWAVISDAAVNMTTEIFEFLKQNPNKSIAAAHQHASLKLMHNKDKPYYAHPMFWAPFMIVSGGQH